MRAPRASSRFARIAVAAVVASGVAAAALAWRARRPPERLPSVTVGGVVREEGCLLCHATTRGLGAAHVAIGCSACHEGDPRARDAASAHRGMDVIAGDLRSVGRTCGQAGCHAATAARVQTSLMAGAPGILAVDRFAFGERPDPSGDAVQDDLRSQPPSPRSPAEAHVRQLCASCHLGARKERRGDLGEEGRGGGCTACHLAPPEDASGGGGPLHPAVSAVVPEGRCAGCHGRSGRIALSFHGKVELPAGDPRVTGALQDGRPIGRAPEDVHARAGMTCVDCHTEREVMGDGAPHRHAHEALDVACADCHAPEPRDATDPDREAVARRLRTSAERRGLGPPRGSTPLRTRAGTPLWRTDARSRTLALAESGAARTIPVATSGRHHALAGHERLTCQACHAAWAPRCGACHTRYDDHGEAFDHLSGAGVRGAWLEAPAPADFGPPLLAVGPRGGIEPFVSGMELRIEGHAPAAVERTLFAPLDPHTTGRARACPSCHTRDADAVYPPNGEVTRVGARLLTAAERARVRRVAGCVGCHGAYEDPVWRDFDESLRRQPAVRACKASAR